MNQFCFVKNMIKGRSKKEFEDDAVVVPEFEEDLDKSSDDLEFSVERLKTTLGDEIESLANEANEQQNDESLKPTAIDVHVG